MRLLLLGALLLIVGVVTPAPAARADFTPGISPPGANDWSCRPTALHPYPVVLVHGTFSDMTVSWNLISPVLKADGYCVFALDYGNRATGRIEDSAAELSAFVQQVLAATGAPRVSMVGHSQGGMMPRYYIKFLAGKQYVDDLLGLVPSNHGTTNPFAAPAGTLGCTACDEQIAGSAFLSGGGGLTSTMTDYLRFAEMLRRGGELDGERILGPRTLKMMTRNHLTGGRDLSQMAIGAFSETAYKGVGFGLGFAITLDEVSAGSIAAGDYYWGGAASTIFWVDPKEDLIVIFMTQLIPSATFNFRGQLKNIVYSAIVD